MSLTRSPNGNLIGILGGIILSSDALFIRLMHFDTAWEIVFVRGLLMWSVCLAVWLCWRGSRATLGSPWLTRDNLLSTLFFCLASAGFVNALHRGNVATVLVIISATPFISALISRIIFQVRIPRSLMLAALVGITGVGVVLSGSGQAGGSALANLYALGTAVAMALAFIFSARVSGGTLALPSLGGVLASLLILLWGGGDLLDHLRRLQPPQLGWALAEGALIMPLAMGLITLSTRYVSPANAGLFLLLETALAPLWIYLFLGERPSPQAVLGGAIIVSAVVGQSLWTRRQQQHTRYADAG
ncbi:DMT family transporter [Pantoea sp. 1.19]|uniref:DMT family transporter n=1 Tax=Pantoea sp. 1.19 TaxID=1925589 RepID=UPI000AC5325E